MLRRDSELRRHEPLNESHGIVKGSRAFPAPQTLRTVRLYHRQVYACAFPRPKLELLYAGALDDKRRGETRSRRLPTFSNASRLIVPHELFSREGDGRVEIPIWLEERDIAALESRWEHHTHAERARPSAPSPTTSISCRLGTAPSMFSDYKPDAHRQARSRDLRSTSLALSHLTGIPLIDSNARGLTGSNILFSRTILARQAPAGTAPAR